jgi:RNA polymerase sigma factor (sigma-70 family)
MRKRPPQHASNLPEDPPSCRAADHAKDIEETYREESRSLLLSLRRLLPSPHDCWDTLHEVFVKVLHRRNLGHAEAGKPYILTAVRNQAYDRLRQRKLRGNIELLLLEDQQSSRQPSPEEACEGAELADLIARAMAALPEEERRALTLVNLDGLSFAEAAVRMARREHKVRRLVAKALLQLQAAIEAGSGDADE